MNTPEGLSAWLELLASRSPEAVFRLGLERVGEVWQRLDITPPRGRVITIAGTNGKGSCALFAEALLSASGYSVGTTLSPHLERFNERIRVGGGELGDAAICAGMQRVEQARGEVPLSYFEHAILAALCCFDARGVDAWVLEVGLGGRLDAVNVVDADVCLIASIGLEHTEWLGSSLDAIGEEKAGILRPGRPLVCGAREMPESVFSAAEALACRLFLPERDFRWRQDESGFQFKAKLTGAEPCLESRAAPRVAPENAAAATMACALLDQGSGIAREAFELACERAVNPGRLETFDCGDGGGVRVVLDLAHNPAAARFLRRQLDAAPVSGQTRAICGFLADKDVAGTVRGLAGLVDHWAFVDTHGARGRTAREVANLAGDELGAVSIERHESVEAAMQSVKSVSLASDRVLVFGSFATVGQARRLLRAQQGLSPCQQGVVPSVL